MAQGHSCFDFLKVGCLLQFFVVFYGLLLACCVMSLNKTIKENILMLQVFACSYYYPEFLRPQKVTWRLSCQSIFISTQHFCEQKHRLNYHSRPQLFPVKYHTKKLRTSFRFNMGESFQDYS